MSNNPIFKFEDAERLQCKASILIEGLPGFGKSGLALMLGYFLGGEDWQKVAAVDTESKSLPLFQGNPSSFGEAFGKFKVGYLTPDIGFAPSYYLTFRDLAVKEGRKVMIKDSISHAWQYKGGVLDKVSTASTKTKSGKEDKYAAWRDPEVMTEKQNIFALIRDPRIHVICTVRIKEKFGVDQSEGTTKIISLGEQEIMQDDLKYEPDLVLTMISPGDNKPGKPIKNPVAKVLKSRYAIFNKDETYEFTPELCRQLKEYLEEGADPSVLLEQQRQDYIAAIKDTLNKSETKRNFWPSLKDQYNVKDTKLEDIPLDVLKTLFISLTSD